MGTTSHSSELLCPLTAKRAVCHFAIVVVTSSESPVVVVLSGSMEPAFHRGDILFLHMGFTPFRAGDIVVFKVQDREIPIVHRVIKVHGPGQGQS